MTTRLLQLAVLTLSLCSAGAAPGNPAPIAVLLQGGHEAPPEHVWVESRRAGLVLQTRSGLDVRQWHRRGAGFELRFEFRNQRVGWFALAGRPWHEGLSLSYTDGLLEAFDHQESRPLLQAPLTLPSDGELSMVRTGPGEHAGYLLAVDAEERGARQLALFWSPGPGPLTRWTPAELRGATTLIELAEGELAFNGPGGRWRFVRVDSRGATQPVLVPGCPVDGDVVALDMGLVACRRAGLGPWALALRSPGGWRDVLGELGFSGAEVEDISLIDDSVFRVVKRGAQDQELRTTFFLLEGGRLRPVSELAPGVPARPRRLELHAGGQVMCVEAATEFGETTTQPRVWLAKDSRGAWRRLNEVVAGAPAETSAAASWAEGAGLGLRSASPPYAWKWFLRDEEAGWRPAAEALPGLGGNVVELRDVRDGLVEVTDGLGESRDRRTWFMRGTNGRWQGVHEVLRTLLPGRDLALDAVDARRDGLTIDYHLVGASESSRLLAYLDEDFAWRALDPSVFGPTPSSAKAESAGFPRITSSSLVAERRLVMLNERDDADGDGQPGEQLVLQRQGDDWSLMNEQRGGRVTSRYDEQRGLLVRSVAGSSGYFLWRADGRWMDVRDALPGSVSRVESAYAFAGGHGLAVRSERGWTYRFESDGKWRALAEVLPNLFPSVHFVLGAGDALTVEEEGDADGNHVAFERRHYVRLREQWRALEPLWRPGAAVDDLRLQDGVLLTAREAWDGNGNGRRFEKLSFLWNPVSGRFEPVGSPSLGDPVEILGTNVTSLFGGRALAVQGTEALVLERDRGGRWRRTAQPSGTWLELRGGADPRLLAARGGNGWQVWCRGAENEPFRDRCGLKPGRSLSVQFEEGAPIVFIQSADGGPWQRWVLREDQLKPAGRAGAPLWWGRSWLKSGNERVRIEGARHFTDGQPTTDVPRPLLWLHRDPQGSTSSAALPAPALLDRWLRRPTAIDVGAVEAVGVGAEGTVVVYRAASGLYAIASTQGPVGLEVVSGMPVLVSQYSAGLERLTRLDAPQRWLFRARHQLGAVFFDDRGYFFSGSEMASARLSFRVGAELLSFSQLGSYLFRPDLLEERMGVASEALFELTERARERRDAAKRLAPTGVDVTQLRPPRLAVTPLGREEQDPRLRLHIVAEGEGLSEERIGVRLVGAGQLTAPLHPARAGWSRLDFERPLELLPGENHLDVRVVDGRGLSASVRLEANFAPAVTRKPRLLAAVVATARYAPEAGLSNLPLTQEDMSLVAAALKEQQGRRFSEVVLRRWCQEPNCEAAPTRREVLEGVRDFFAEARPGDYVMLYVSGHGLRLGDGYFMVPADGRPDFPESLVGWSELKSAVTSAAPGKKLVMFDTCHAGAVLPTAEGRGGFQRFVQEAAEYEGVYLLTATAADASAYELSSLGGGVFTTVLTEGLRGGADRDSDGLVSFEELSFHVARRVRELSTVRQVRMEPALPVLDERLDFIVAASAQGRAVGLRVTDVSTFDAAALPGRREFWVARLESERLSPRDGSTALLQLVIVEDRGAPLRAQLSDADGQPLAQWSSLTEPSFLRALRERVEARLPAARCAGRGLAPACPE